MRTTFSIRKNDRPGTIRTKMAEAMILALENNGVRGKSSGHIGACILKANARGAGIKYVPRKQQELKAA